MKLNKERVAAVASLLTSIAWFALPAAAQEVREIAVENQCNSRIRVLIHHADKWRNWHPHAWFTFEPGEGPTTLSSDGVTLHQLTDHDLYFYAESLDKEWSWEGNALTVRFGAEAYGLIKANTAVVRGRTRLNISCSRH